MDAFEQEIAYLQSQRLARIATVDANGQPTVDAVGFSLDGGQILIGTHSPRLSRKYRNVLDGNTAVALIVDDLASIQPWQPRGIKIHGVAEVVERQGPFRPGKLYRHHAKDFLELGYRAADRAALAQRKPSGNSRRFITKGWRFKPRLRALLRSATKPAVAG